MKKNMKREVMLVANEIKTATGKSKSVCVAKAWQLYRLRCKLTEGSVRFAYERADGRLRKATGTLANVDHLVKGTGRKIYKTFRYFDVNAGAFRSFRVENLVSIY